MLGQSGNWGDSEDRHNQYDSWTLQLGLDKDIGDRWQMQARIQRGATDRFTEVFNEIRVDREMLAIDAVEVYNDRRDLTNDAGTGGPDGRPDLITDALRGTGTIICNVQRYNPTDAQLAGVGRERPRAGRAGRRFARADGDPLYPVPIPSPGRARRDPELRADEHLRPGQRQRRGGRLRRVAESTATAPSRRSSPRCCSRATSGTATVRARSRWPSAPRTASSGSGSAAIRRTHEAYGPPLNVDGLAERFMDLGIRGIQGGFTTGSPNLHEFSTVPTIKGGYDVWETFTEFNMPLWRVGVRLAAARGRRRGAPLRLLDERRHQLVEDRHQPAGRGVPAIPHARVSRDVREPTFNERFDVQGGGGSITENAIGTASRPATARARRRRSRSRRRRSAIRT